VAEICGPVADVTNVQQPQQLIPHCTLTLCME